MSRKIITISALCVLMLGLGAATSLAGDINVPGDYATIQLAINAATAGDVIHVAAGTYTENFDVNKRVLIVGAGSGSDPASNTVITQDTAGSGDTKVGVAQLSASGASAADPILLQDLRLEPVGMAGISVGRFYEATGTTVSYVKLDNVYVIGTNVNPSTEQERGLYVDLTSSLYHLDVDDCAFDNLTYGWYTQKEVSADASTVQYVTVDNTTFNHNNHKGIYAEKLSDATFTACTTDNNGFDSSLLPSYFQAWSCGFDINLKAGTYANIAFVGCIVTANAIDEAKEGVGLTVKARDDGANYGAYPATVDNVDVISCTITGNERGLRFGEPSKDNATPTNVTVEDCVLHSNTQHYSGGDGSAYGELINMTASGNVVDASLNWWGDLDPSDQISGEVDYSPWYAAVPGTSPMPIGTDDSIQDAIDAASSGATIDVAAGTYREQLKIDGKSLDLTGAGVGSTILEAVELVDRASYSITQWTGGPRPIDACIGVTGAGTVNISDMTVDGRELGPDNFYGIHFFDTSGSVTDCRIEDILYAASPGASRVASLVATHSVDVVAYTIDFSSNVIPNFQKGGVLLMGPYLTFTVDDNEITNVPSNILAGNGMQLSYGATGTTSGNVVHGVGYTGEDWSATGILLFESGDISMDGDIVHACESGVNYSNWGWVYSHPSAVDLSFADLLLYDNAWALSAQLSCDNADLNFAADGCMILDSTGDGIDLYGTDLDPWGGGYYMGWDNGDLVADITNCVITGTALEGIWIDDYSGNATNTMDVEVHYTAMEGSASSGLWNSSSYGVDAEYCWWGDPTGPTVIPEPGRGNRPAAPPVSPYGSDLPDGGEVRYAESSSSRAGDGVHGIVDYDPWLGGNIVCDPDPQVISLADDVGGGVYKGEVVVEYVGGGSGDLWGYSIDVAWDNTVVSAVLTDFSRPDNGPFSTMPAFMFQVVVLESDGSGAKKVRIDAALGGSTPGTSGPCELFKAVFTAFDTPDYATSAVGLVIQEVRDSANQDLTGFFSDDGEVIVDLVGPVITVVSIQNDTVFPITGSHEWVKDTDDLTVYATVTDGGGLASVTADATDFGGGGSVAPDASTTYEWTLISVNTSGANGSVGVEVTATDTYGNTSTGSDAITADNLVPGAISGFAAAPGHNKAVLSWDDPTTTDTNFYKVEIQSNAWGDYPTYTGGTSYPTDQDDGTDVWEGTGNGHTAAYATDSSERNIHYYGAFASDWALNYSPDDSDGQDRSTNYWLGDVARPDNTWNPDGYVYDPDIVKLSGIYGSAPSDEFLKCNVGPTDDHSRVGIPYPDALVDFEDLMIFAMNYDVVNPTRVVPFFGDPGEGDLALALVENGRTSDGMVELALRLEGNLGDVKGLTAEFEFEGLEFLSARLSDEMVSPLADVFFWSNATSHSVQVDAAVLGTDVTIGGSGDVAVLTFQVLDEAYAVEFTSAKLRGAGNEDLTAELEGLSSEGVPVAFKLVQNAPNPFNPVTKVAYHVPSESRVTIRVFDVTGRVVTTLADGVVEAGRHAVVWNGTNDAGESVGSGVYFCTMETPDYSSSLKMTLLK